LAKEELDEAAHLAAIVRSSAVAIYSEDLDANINSWNPAAEQMYGYAASEVLGQPIYLTIPDDRVEEERDVQRRIHAGEEVGCYNTVRQRKDGKRIHVSMVASPVRTTAGVLIGVSKVARDISAQKEIEAKLTLESALVELSDEAIFAWGLHDGIVEWNTGCERLYGYPREYALGRSSHELLATIHPLPLDAFLTRLSERREWSGELYHHTPDGREVIVESRHQVIDVDGRSIVLETNRDVTERRRGESARGQLAALVESSEDAIVGKDLSGIVTSWNHAAERMFGFCARGYWTVHPLDHPRYAPGRGG
jgi:PAS domain S-box-containing protein